MAGTDPTYYEGTALGKIFSIPRGSLRSSANFNWSN